MTGVGEGERAGCIDEGAEAGSKAALLAVEEQMVEGAEHGSGLGSGHGIEGADHSRDEHGGAEALAADIADDDARALLEAGGVEEIAADFLRGAVDGVDVEGRGGALGSAQEKRLDALGGFELGGGARLLLADAGEAEEHDDADGEEKEEVGEIEGLGRQDADRQEIAQGSEQTRTKLGPHDAGIVEGDGEHG